MGLHWYLVLGEDVLVGALDQRGPVFDAAAHAAAVDEVEGGPGRPVALDVVDFEGYYVGCVRSLALPGGGWVFG